MYTMKLYYLEPIAMSIIDYKHHLIELSFILFHVFNSNKVIKLFYILKSSPKHTCYMTDTTSDENLFSLVFTQFIYFPQDVSEMHISLHSTKLQLILCYDSL